MPAASTARLVFGTAFALAAFAANSLLCREALAGAQIDAVAFTVLRLCSGALFLATLAAARGGSVRGGSWGGALALAVYALPFALAYRQLPAGVGALVLFGCVQLTVLIGDRLAGGRWRALDVTGMLLAVAGLAVFALPGAAAPAPAGVLWMAIAGLAWGLYTLRGRRSARPLAETTGNFVRAALLVAPCWLLADGACPARGVWLAVCSGALASGCGYVVWYAVLPGLGAFRAAVLQLAVPLIAALGGITLLGESWSLRLAMALPLVCCGIAATLRPVRRA